MAATSVSVSASIDQSRGWLRNPTFDFHFIWTVAVLAIVTGCVAIVRPDLFQLFLLLDVWLLGYHHVVSTFTRLAFDRKSFQQNKFLVVHLPIIVLASTVAAIYFVGPWTLATTYLYWQWFHYTRQSYGIERMYRRKADKNDAIDDYATTRMLYAVPLFGILYRSWQQPTIFLGVELFTFAVPTWVNTTIRSFPVNLTAMVFGYDRKPNFQPENEAEISTPPQVDFDRDTAGGD